MCVIADGSAIANAPVTMFTANPATAGRGD
jgi:hypothetical protein